MKGRTLAALALSAALAAAAFAACGRGAEPSPPVGGGIPMRPAPPPSALDRIRARLEPVSLYGEVEPLGGEGGGWRLAGSATSSYRLRAALPGLDFSRFAGKRVEAVGWIEPAGPELWALRVRIVGEASR